MNRSNVLLTVSVLLIVGSVPLLAAELPVRPIAPSQLLPEHPKSGAEHFLEQNIDTSDAAPAAPTGATQRLAELVSKLESIMPSSWRVVEADSSRLPIGWHGKNDGVYVMIEDTNTRFFHPNGFHYYSFYRVWLMPPVWEGEMRRTPYVSDSVPAFLLGASDDHVAFYHTAGGNVWEEGPSELASVLGLERIRFSDLTHRIVDLTIEQRLREHTEELSVPAVVFSPERIIGLAGDGPNLYLEYQFAPAVDAPPDEYLSDLTGKLAATVFDSFPEIESIYLRRCESDTFTDTIVNRD